MKKCNEIGKPIVFQVDDIVTLDKDGGQGSGNSGGGTNNGGGANNGGNNTTPVVIPGNNWELPNGGNEEEIVFVENGGQEQPLIIHNDGTVVIPNGDGTWRKPINPGGKIIDRTGRGDSKLPLLLLAGLVGLILLSD